MANFNTFNNPYAADDGSNKPLRISSASANNGANGQGNGSNGQGAGATGQGQTPTGIPNPGMGETQGQGSGFVNLQQVLDANKGDSTKMVGALNDQANQYGQSATDAMSVANANFNKDKTRAPGYSASTSAYAYGNLPVLPGASSGTMSQDPNSGFQNAMAAAQKAQDYTKRLGSYGGLATNLQGLYGGQQYSSGENSLDAILSGSNPGNYSDVTAKYGDLINQFNQADVASAPKTATPSGGPVTSPYGIPSGIDPNTGNNPYIKPTYVNPGTTTNYSGNGTPMPSTYSPGYKRPTKKSYG